MPRRLVSSAGNSPVSLSRICSVDGHARPWCSVNYVLSARLGSVCPSPRRTCLKMLCKLHLPWFRIFVDSYCIVLFLDVFLQLMRIRSYWFLALCFGGGVGLLSTLVTVLDQLLCPHGYSDVSILLLLFTCAKCVTFLAKQAALCPTQD